MVVAAFEADHPDAVVDRWVSRTGGRRRVPLLSGRAGLHSGAGEAYTLASELARTDDHRDAFARYEQRLAPLLRPKQDAAQGLGLAFAPKNGLQLCAPNTLMRMMGLPKVADIVMGKSFHDAVELPPFPKPSPLGPR